MTEVRWRVTLSLVMQTCWGTSAAIVRHSVNALHGNLHTNNLDLDINLNEALAQRIDLDKTRVDSTIETTELGDQTDITLRDMLIRIRADNAARDGSQVTYAVTKSVDYEAISQVLRRGIVKVSRTYSCHRTSHCFPHRCHQQECPHS